MIAPPHSIARIEWRLVLSIAMVMAGLMQVPYLLGHALAPGGVEYTGLLINLEDYSYHAIMLQGRNGAWQYHIQYTTEPHAPAFLYGFYLFLGHLSRVLGVSIIEMWHAARVFASLVMLIAAFVFIARWLRKPSERWTAYLIAVFGSGFDWVLFPWERFEPTSGTPLDFRMPEMHLFFTGLTYPHIALGISLILAAFWFWLDFLAGKSWRNIFALAIAILFVGIIYPFLIFLLAGVLGASSLYQSYGAKRILWRDAFALALAFAPSAPLYAYYAIVLETNPVFRIWNDQAATYSANPLHYFLSYGAMIGLALGLPHSQGRDQFAFLWLWILVVVVLLYAPLGAQRRFVQGVHIPLAILASAGLHRGWLPRLEEANWFRRLAARPNYSVQGLRRFVVITLLLALSAANWVVLLKLSALTAIEQPAAFFVPRGQLAAIDWLGANARHEDPIVAAYWTSGLIPARAGNVVFAGQHYETNHFEEKSALVAKFYNENSDDAFRRDLLAEYHIAYVFWGPRERVLGDFNPNARNYLKRVFQNDAVSIYRVLTEPN